MREGPFETWDFIRKGPKMLIWRNFLLGEGVYSLVTAIAAAAGKEEKEEAV